MARFLSRWFVIVVAVAAVASAQPHGYLGMPLVRNYLAKEYRGNTQVWTILRDRRGLLYAGAGGSEVHQFDGATWRGIPVPGDVVRSLALDSQGKLWVGERAEFGYLEPDAEALQARGDCAAKVMKAPAGNAALSVQALLGAGEAAEPEDAIVAKARLVYQHGARLLR